MRFALLVASATALVWAAGATAGPPVLASPGPSPFLGCTADQAGVQQAAGSTLYPNAEIEPRADVNPTDARNIVGFYQQDRWSDGGSRGLVTSVSRDGGSSWHRVVMPGVSKCSGGNYDRVSDPWLSFAPNGDLYAISLSFDYFDTHNAIIVSKSTTKGESWGAPLEVTADDTNGLDKQSITADPVDSRFVYAAWDRLETITPTKHESDESNRKAKTPYTIGPTWFSRTTNAGRSWEPARVIYDPGPNNSTIGSIINVLPNGGGGDGDRSGDNGGNGGALVDGLLVFRDENKPVPKAEVAVLRSNDRGQSWSERPTTVSKIDALYNLTGPTDPDNGQPIRSGTLPDFTVDRRSGTLYAVWEDDTVIAGVSAVMFSQSTDGGRSWSMPVKINRTPTSIPAGNQTAFTPTVKVAANGTVAVTYYDLRSNTPAPGLPTDYWMVRCASSCTNPSRWTETHVAGPFDEEQAAFAGGLFLGDYEGMVALGNTFGAFFMQAVTRAGNPSDAFFATVP